ncbi:hypothetical protein ACQPYH_11650 [Kribbella sp. CA-245084]
MQLAERAIGHVEEHPAQSLIARPRIALLEELGLGGHRAGGLALDLGLIK